MDYFLLNYFFFDLRRRLFLLFLWFWSDKDFLRWFNFKFFFWFNFFNLWLNFNLFHIFPFLSLLLFLFLLRLLLLLLQKFLNKILIFIFSNINQFLPKFIQNNFPQLMSLFSQIFNHPRLFNINCIFLIKLLLKFPIIYNFSNNHMISLHVLLTYQNLSVKQLIDISQCMSPKIKEVQCILYILSLNLTCILLLKHFMYSRKFFC